MPWLHGMGRLPEAGRALPDRRKCRKPGGAVACRCRSAAAFTSGVPTSWNSVQLSACLSPTFHGVLTRSLRPLPKEAKLASIRCGMPRGEKRRERAEAKSKRPVSVVRITSRIWTRLELVRKRVLHVQMAQELFPGRLICELLSASDAVVQSFLAGPPRVAQAPEIGEATPELLKLRRDSRERSECGALGGICETRPRQMLRRRSNRATEGPLRPPDVAARHRGGKLCAFAVTSDDEYQNETSGSGKNGSS